MLYDVSSSYYEGHTCPLIAYGHNREGDRGMLTQTRIDTLREYPGIGWISVRRRKREDLLIATEKHLLKIQTEAKRRTKKPLTESEIGMKVGKVIASKCR